MSASTRHKLNDQEIGVFLWCAGSGRTLKSAAELATTILDRPVTADQVAGVVRRYNDRRNNYAGPVAAQLNPANDVASDLAEVALLVPDTHVPFHDQRALDLVHKCADVLKPSIVAILGDFADFYAVSFHSKDPGRAARLKDENAVTRRELARFKSKRKVFVKGNHEYRLDRYIADKAPALSGMVDVDTALGLTESGWEVVEYRDHIKLGKLHLTHETGSAGSTAHTKSGEAFQASVAIGHSHRASVTYFGDAFGKTHVAAMFGWLGDRSKIDYMHRISVYRNWQLGFGVAYIEPNGVTHVAAVPIIDYKAVVNGQLIIG